MSKFFAWISQLLGKKPAAGTQWDNLNYGKPSTAGDDFRKSQDV